MLGILVSVNFPNYTASEAIFYDSSSIVKLFRIFELFQTAIIDKENWKTFAKKLEEKSYKSLMGLRHNNRIMIFGPLADSLQN